MMIATFGVLRFKVEPLSKGHSKFVPHISERELPALALGSGQLQYIYESPM